MHTTQTTNISIADVWRTPLILTSTLIVALLLIYYPATSSMIHTWNKSETFTHGYLILPIALWLIWRNRSDFYHITPAPNYYAIPLILLASFGWLIAYFVDVQVIQQLAMVSMIPLVVFGVLGWQVVKTAIFPLFFLVFAVPMGEGLVPVLIEFTADFTVAMVQLTGIPIYREGTFFQLPTGNWSVVEACSGVRYLIASVTLGFLYAYLTYKSIYRRALFVIASIAVPIIANGLRAFIIVMIGHFSDMKLATGVDHLVYGWFFFGIVIAIMFYIGSFWREEDKVEEQESDLAKMNTGLPNQRQMLLSTGILLIAILVLPITAYTDKPEIMTSAVALQTPKSNQWQHSDQTFSDWTPRFQNMDASLLENYQQQGASVDLFVGYYAAQRDEAQLITSTNVLVTEDNDDWKSIGTSNIALQLQGKTVTVPLVHLKSANKAILVAYFYYLDDQVTTNRYHAKLIEAKSRLLGGDNAGSMIAVSAELKDNREQTLAEIKKFSAEMSDAIFQSVRNVKRS